MNYSSLGEKIREHRKLLHWSQARLAQTAHLSVSFLGQIERGTHAASIATLVRLCNALDVSPDELLLESLRLSNRPVAPLTPREQEILLKVRQLLR